LARCAISGESVKSLFYRDHVAFSGAAVKGYREF
jgi:hypothetical protein